MSVEICRGSESRTNLQTRRTNTLKASMPEVSPRDMSTTSRGTIEELPARSKLAVEQTEVLFHVLRVVNCKGRLSDCSTNGNFLLCSFFAGDFLTPFKAASLTGFARGSASAGSVAGSFGSVGLRECKRFLVS